MKTGGKKHYKFLAYMAEKALKEAVAEAIDEHRRNGVPIAVWRNGRVVLVPATRMMVREPQAEYLVTKRKKNS
jgi:hypothetical protein